MICTRSKMSRRALAAALIGASLALAPVAFAESIDSAGARAVIEQAMSNVLDVLGNPKLSVSQKQKRIETIAGDRFDFGRISKLVLARNWKKLDAAQRDAFVVEFRRHLSLTYGRRLSGFTEETVQVGDILLHSNQDVTVKTKIVGGKADGVTMDYRMRDRDGSWYAIDVVIEGVSMIANFRSQVQEIVSSRGADGLIEALRKKNDREAKKAREPSSG